MLTAERVVIGRKIPRLESGTPAIDSRRQNSFLKQKQSKKTAKGKANKKAKKNKQKAQPST